MLSDEKFVGTATNGIVTTMHSHDSEGEGRFFGSPYSSAPCSEGETRLHRDRGLEI